jgi:hypothetical protein
MQEEYDCITDTLSLPPRMCWLPRPFNSFVRSCADTGILLLLLQVAISLAAYALVGLVGFIDSLDY